MRLKTWYKIHKWVSVAMGALLFLWLFTGMVMIMPATRASRSTNRPPAIDYQRIVVTPGAAVSKAAEHGTFDRGVRDVSIVGVLDKVAYLVQPWRGDPVLIDAVAGEQITIDSATAVAIAAALLDDPKMVRAERLTRYTASYIGGALPVWKVEFGNGMSVTVDPFDGHVRGRSMGQDRFREYNAQLHSFGPLRFLPGGSGTQHWTLWITGGFSIVTVLTGLYLSLPKRWKVKRRASV